MITGTDNKAFPVPLKKNASGQWYFDTAAGRQEILARRRWREELYGENGVVCEKDLGKTTEDTAKAITEFNPDKTWKAIEP